MLVEIVVRHAQPSTMGKGVSATRAQFIREAHSRRIPRTHWEVALSPDEKRLLNVLVSIPPSVHGRRY